MITTPAKIKPDLLKEARERYDMAIFIGTVKAYCESPECNVRYIDITLKEHEGLTDGHPACPYCHTELNIHRVLSRVEGEQRRWKNELTASTHPNT